MDRPTMARTFIHMIANAMLCFPPFQQSGATLAMRIAQFGLHAMGAGTPGTQAGKPGDEASQT